MKISKVPTPDVYKRESMDFRFFLKWFEEALTRIKYDHDHISDLYDPLRCPDHLLWMLADEMGYKYDDRLPPAFCRLVLLYFMSMIRLKGSKNGMTLAAEVNLAQHNINEYGKENEILYNRLEDTSIPVNSVSVIPHIEEGYIDVVYFSQTKPIDACTEYVRPAGMYVFSRPGVTVHARTKIWIDAMLTDRHDMQISIGPTKIGHYSREDYARLQKMREEHGDVRDKDSTVEVKVPEVDFKKNAEGRVVHQPKVDTEHRRKPVWRRNVKYEVTPDGEINPGYRALYNLQMSNNEHIVRSLIPEMFSLGYGPHLGDTESDEYFLENQDIREDRPWDIKNLRHRDVKDQFQDGWSYLDQTRAQSPTRPRPRVNPILARIGDAIPMTPNPLEPYDNKEYTVSTDPEDKGKEIVVKPQDKV